MKLAMPDEMLKATLYKQVRTERDRSVASSWLLAVDAKKETCVTLHLTPGVDNTKKKSVIALFTLKSLQFSPHFFRITHSFR